MEPWVHIPPNISIQRKKIYDFDPRIRNMQCRPVVIQAPMPWHKFVSLVLQYWVRKGNLAGARIYACLRIVGRGARMAGPIETGEAFFDQPEWRKNDRANCKEISKTRCVSSAIVKRNSAKRIKRGCRSNQWTHANNTRWANCHRGRVRALGLL